MKILKRKRFFSFQFRDRKSKQKTFQFQDRKKARIVLFLPIQIHQPTMAPTILITLALFFFLHCDCMLYSVFLIETSVLIYFRSTFSYIIIQITLMHDE